MEKTERKPQGYWQNYEHCYEEAKKYHRKVDFQKRCGRAYQVARINGWLDDYDWFEEICKPDGYWDYEHCYNAAKECSTTVEFRKKYKVAYTYSRRMKWHLDYYWLDGVRAIRCTWNNYDNCYEEAKKYSTRTEFSKKAAGAYAVALKNGWIDDYTWFLTESEAISLGLTYWTMEKCYEAALCCKSRSEFSHKYCSAFGSAYRNGWLKDYTWFKKQSHEDDDYWVYAYEDVENKAVYVGLTFRKERHREHKTDETDTARLYFESINKPLPEPRIKMDNLNAEDAQYYEDWYKQKYAEAGWKVINKGKTGVGTGSLGSGAIKWDYEHCKEEALKYETRTDFRVKSGGAYEASRRNGWLDDFTWFTIKRKPVGYWTYERCIEEAMKYSTRQELRDNNEYVYKFLLKNGWLDEWFGKRNYKPMGYWNNYERCREEALKFDTKKDFQKSCSGGFNSAFRHGWLDDFFPKVA